jgi:potassium efflux system protein
MLCLAITDLTGERLQPHNMIMEAAVFSDFFEVLSQFVGIVLSIWNHQITVVAGNPVTIGKIIKGITLLVLGYYLAFKASNQIEKRLLSRLDVDPSIQHTLKTIIFYLMLVTLTLFTLSLLNVPIAAFTFLGGALAIGVGLGAQNIANNFISGLIIMLERPIRLGDFVELDTTSGTVEAIGTRATRIKSMDNTHIVVPNSAFLEKNVLNWTLSDDVVRTKVVVGVAYGSPTRETERLLMQAAVSHSRVLKSPEPVVLFSEFGDNSLVFEVLFWSRIRNMLQLKTIASDIRFKIDDLFREAGITIAFPQRDVHLDSLSPIEVKLSKASLEQ